jgi:hypothetical protein
MSSPMIEYQNRFGDTYFLQAGKTKTGKPKYYFGKKVTAEPIQAIPDGYEIRENPESGQVTLRKIRPTEIGLLEKQMLSDGVRAYAKLKHFIVDVDGNSLVVYIPGTREQDALEVAQQISGTCGGMLAFASRFAEEIVTRSHYSPMMRFTLCDCDERLFYLERWCFLGSIDDWFQLTGPIPLPSLIEKYVRHLGKESFYELI